MDFYASIITVISFYKIFVLVTNILFIDCDHLGQNSDHSGQNSDHSGQNSDHSNQNSDQVQPI